MANSIISAPIEIETGTLLTTTWGTVTYLYDKHNHICYCRFTGNDNSTPNAGTDINLPDKLKSKIAMLSPLYLGGHIEINTGGWLHLTTIGVPWQAGSLVWPTF